MYQTKSGTTTATLTNIKVVDRNGTTMTGYAFVGADAESTDTAESITSTSDTPLYLISNIANACNAGLRYAPGGPRASTPPTPKTRQVPLPPARTPKLPPIAWIQRAEHQRLRPCSEGAIEKCLIGLDRFRTPRAGSNGCCRIGGWSFRQMAEPLPHVCSVKLTSVGL